jgi:hypothetical protein
MGLTRICADPDYTLELNAVPSNVNATGSPIATVLVFSNSTDFPSRSYFGLYNLTGRAWLFFNTFATYEANPVINNQTFAYYESYSEMACIALSGASSCSGAIANSTVLSLRWGTPPPVTTTTGQVKFPTGGCGMAGFPACVTTHNNGIVGGDVATTSSSTGSVSGGIILTLGIALGLTVTVLAYGLSRKR